jgi:hypothetical protein
MRAILPQGANLVCLRVCLYAGWLQAAPAAASYRPGPLPGHASLPSLPSDSYHEAPAGEAPDGAPGSEQPAAPPAAAAAGAGFTHVAAMGSGGGGSGEAGWQGGGGLVVAGTAGGCLCLLDLDRGELAGHLDCAPSALVGVAT